MAELALAVRRSIAITLLLALGALAAALPVLLGEPAGEHPALRGLAALLIILSASLLLVARWGHRGALAPKAHLLELGKLAGTATLLLLPALFAGVSSTEVQALARWAQAPLDWNKPISATSLGLLLLVATYLVSRLKSSVEERRLQGRWLVGVSVVVWSALVLASAGRLLLVPALSGLELLEKRVVLLVLVNLAVAAFFSGGGDRRTFDPRTLALGVGLVVVGLLSSYFTYRYLRPSVGDIARICVTEGDGTETTFAAFLEGRPDIYGLFSLEYASATPRLEFVRSLEEAKGDLLEKVHRTSLGTARLVPRPPQNERARRVPPLEESFEVWIRWRWWPWNDLRPGLRIGEPVLDWAVAPNARLAVATTYEGSPESWKIPWSEGTQGTYAVMVWRGAEESRNLLDKLAQPPRILELTNSFVRLSTPPSLAWPSPLATTSCNLDSFTCEPWKSGSIGGSGPSKPKDRELRQNYGSWIVLDTRTLATVLQAPPHGACAGDCDRAYLLRDGRVVRVLLLGYLPNWDARLSVFDAVGRETLESRLGNIALTRFAGELDDETVAIAWRTQPIASQRSPVFGWTLESWNTTTGERRRLADDLATFPAPYGDASTIFLDRRGRLVAPAVGGVRVLAELDAYRPVKEK